MYHHRITYKPQPEVKKTQLWFEAALGCLVFAIIGCLLAWRG
jgi:hypothetical protein